MIVWFEMSVFSVRFSASCLVVFNPSCLECLTESERQNRCKWQLDNCWMLCHRFSFWNKPSTQIRQLDWCFLQNRARSPALGPWTTYFDSSTSGFVSAGRICLWKRCGCHVRVMSLCDHVFLKTRVADSTQWYWLWQRLWSTGIPFENKQRWQSSLDKEISSPTSRERISMTTSILKKIWKCIVQNHPTPEKNHDPPYSKPRNKKHFQQLLEVNGVDLKKLLTWMSCMHLFFVCRLLEVPGSAQPAQPVVFMQDTGDSYGVMGRKK